MVPEKIGRHRDGASLFSAMWGKYVGYHHLMYTRTPEGRRTLLKARGFATSSAFDDRSRIVSKWK
jgi:hypothetical protein